MTSAVARGKIARGVKRRCAKCATLFYDLLHYPIQCPKCGAPFVDTRPSSSSNSTKRFKPAIGRARAGAAVILLAQADQQIPSGDRAEDAELGTEQDQEDAILDREG